MRRWALMLAATVCGGLALLQFAAESDSSPGSAVGASAGASATISSPGQATPAGGSSAAQSPLVAQGRSLFASSCAACHGISAQGIHGRGPSLHGVGALAADFYLQTGRMPLPSPRAQPMRTKPAFPQSQIRALTAYVASFGGPAIPVVRPSRGSPAEGQRLFSLNCAGCHTIQGQGGIVTGAVVPSLNEATPTQVAEAIRVGPYVMPRFGEGELSSGAIDSLARYVQSIQHPDDRGGWGIGRIGPIPEGMVAWLLAATALLLIARLIGERTPDERPRGGVRHE
jgi:ubiquinol-cytochrome c reductase cytochrome c subunit